MAIIHIQVGKNIVDNVFIDGRVNVNIIIENLIIKFGLPKPILAPYHLRMGRSKYDRTSRNHQKFENSFTWYSIYSHIYCFEK